MSVTVSPPPVAAEGKADLENRQLLLQRVLASPHFQKSPRLRDFLSYVCERTFAGRPDEISEHQIGIHVFGRPPEFNPAEDTIVRATARQLRQKLEIFNLGDSTDSRLRLTIPKGSYVPLFEIIETCVRVNLPEQEIVDIAPDRVDHPVGLVRRFGRRTLIAVSLCAVMVVAGLSLVPSPAPRTIFWRAILAADHPALLVSGDSGLAMTMNITHRTVDVREYAEKKLEPQPLINPSLPTNSPTVKFGQQRYTSVSDLNMAVRTMAAAGQLSRKLDVKYARDVTVDELKAQNIILVGDSWGNPWVELFSKQLNFEFQIDAPTSSHLIVNRAPAADEEASYRVYPDDPDHKNYALIALTRGLGRQGRALLVEGTTVAGIDTAVDFLFNSEQFSDVLKKAIHGDSVDDFEVLLETENVAASSAQFKVIGVRVHQLRP